MNVRNRRVAPLAPQTWGEHPRGRAERSQASPRIGGRGAEKACLAVLALLFVTLFASGCSSDPTPTPTPAATPLPDFKLNAGGAVRASGNIEPAQMAELAFSYIGRVQDVAVERGAPVAEGDVLIVLDAAEAEAETAQARSALFEAQASLEDITNGARLEEIARAQANVDAAEARLAQLAESARPEAVAAAESEVRAAKAASSQLFNGPRESERVNALVALSNAEAAVQQAQSAYNGVAWRSDVSAQPESRQLQQATNTLEAAQARYDALYAAPDADLVAEAQARIQRAEAELDRLLAPGSENEVAEAEAQVRSAQADLDLLTAGASDAQIASAAMAVTQAEAGLKSVQATLDAKTLRAPFDGTVTTVHVNPGEAVQPGVSVLTMADLDHLRMETTDLSERDVARVAVGQPASIFVKPLNEEYPGEVVQIAPQANVIGGDVVYTVVIEFEQQPPDLRWGMSADVDIEADIEAE